MNPKIGDIVEVKLKRIKNDVLVVQEFHAVVVELDTIIGETKTALGFVARYLEFDDFCYFVYGQSEWWRIVSKA